MKEIRRRCPAIVKAAEDEDARLQQSSEDGRKMGRDDALKDLREGHLVLEVSTRDNYGDGDFEAMLAQRYQARLRRLNPDANPNMANSVFSHMDGNNSVAQDEITRRFRRTRRRNLEVVLQEPTGVTRRQLDSGRARAST